MPGQEYLNGTPEEQAAGFITELKRNSEAVALHVPVFYGELLHMFVSPGQDEYPTIRGLNEEIDKYFKPNELLAVKMGKYLLGEFGRNFGWDSSAWDLGLTTENKDLQVFFEKTAQVILGCLERKNDTSTLDAVNEALSAHERIIAWVNERFNSPRV